MRKNRLPTMTITGLDEVMDNMRKLGEDVEKRLAKQAAEIAMVPVVDAAKALCPVGTGSLRESIGVKKIRMRGRYRKGMIVVSVGPRKGFDYAYVGGNRKHDPFKYGIPVEFGHVTKKGSFVPAVTFMRTAYQNQKEGIVTRFTEELKKKVDRALRKQAKQAAGA